MYNGCDDHRWFSPSQATPQHALLTPLSSLPARDQTEPRSVLFSSWIYVAVYLKVTFLLREYYLTQFPPTAPHQEDPSPVTVSNDKSRAHTKVSLC